MNRTLPRSFASAFRPAALIALAACAVIGCSKSSDLSTPKSAAKSFMEALQRGDAAAAKQASTGGDAQVIDAWAAATASVKKLQDAAVAKFGEDGKKISAGGTAIDVDKKLDEAEAKVEGDTATLTAKGQSSPLKLKKVDGDWKVDVSEMTKMMSGIGGGDAGSMFQASAKAADETAAEISAGKYKTVDEARAAFGGKMVSSMMGGLKLPQK